MSNFYMRHKRNVKKFHPLTKEKIEPGQIILFRYKGKKGGASDKLAIVLNVFPFAGSQNVRKVHAMSLNNLSLTAFRQFLNKLQVPRLEYDDSKKMFNILLEGGTRGSEFYKSVVSKFNKEDAYRTYTLKNIISPKLVEYNFEKINLTFKSIEEVNKAVQYDEKLIGKKISQTMVDNPGITRDMAEQMVVEDLGLDKQ